MKRIQRWFRWRVVRVLARVMYWRLRLAGASAEEAYDEVMLLLRSSRLVAARGGGDPWKHMASAARDGKGDDRG